VPAQVVENMKLSILAKTGYMPNCVISGAKVHSTLKNNADVKDAVKHTEKAFAGLSTHEQWKAKLAAYFDVQHYIPCMATRDTAVEGQTSTPTLFAEKVLWVGYVDFGVSQMEVLNMRPTAFARFIFDCPGGVKGRRVASYFDQKVKSQLIDGDMHIDWERVALDLGNYASAVVA